MKYRLYPTIEQEEILVEQCAQSRYLWNLGLEQQNWYTIRMGPTPNFPAKCRQLTELRKENAWLAAGSQTAQQQAFKDLDQAFRNWWKNPGHFGRPTWRKAGQHEGFRIVGSQAKRFERLSRHRARVLIPKVGWVDWRWSKDPGEINSYRVKKDPAGRWWIAFASIPDAKENPRNGLSVGIDCGTVQSFTLSTGEIIQIEGLKESEKKKLLTLQRKLARQELGSKRRERTKQAINKIIARKTNRKKDKIEKLTTRLAIEYEQICIEDLKISNMTKSAKGTLEEPGKNVAAKSGLNRSILENGWGLFAQRLEDKAPERVIRVNPAYTSQCCSQCGYVSQENRQSQAVFHCRSCGLEANADVNAAIVIAAGQAVIARGESSTDSVKREPHLTLTG